MKRAAIELQHFTEEEKQSEKEEVKRGKIEKENEIERGAEGAGGATQGSCFYSLHSPTSITCVWTSVPSRSTGSGFKDS